MVAEDNQTQAVNGQTPPARKPLVIAIDGPAGAGKSTVARRVADALGYLYIDTGAMYRAATWLVLRQNINVQDLERIVALVAAAELTLSPGDAKSGGRVRVFVDGQEVTLDIRSQEVTRLVSPISAIPGVRQHLVEKQQKLAGSGGVVMDGRDIGTVVLPAADIKVFLTASPEVRAERRLKELAELGEKPALPTLLQEIKDRDRQDSTRAVAPLRQAQDAIPINTDEMTIEDVVTRILNLCKRQC
jgi:cytidylate kinase